MTTLALTMGRRIRPTPYLPRVMAAGAKSFTVYNHMLLATSFRSLEDDYWHLREHVQLWDVSCERQVALSGPDAARLAQMMTPRDLSRAVVGQCVYAPLVDVDGGLVNDPVILKLDEDRFWLSIADSDVLLWAKGLALGFGLDVAVEEPPVYPLAVQGPKAEALVARVFGDAVRAIRFFRFERLPFRGRPLVVARSGWSKQGGFEIYLDDPSLAIDLWDALWQAGADLDVGPGCPNTIERVEGGLLSYGNEMTRDNTPYEVGLDRFCKLDGPDFLAKPALRRIAAEGPMRLLRGIRIDGPPLAACTIPWALRADDRAVGSLLTAVWSPRLECTIGFAMMERGWWDDGTEVEVLADDSKPAAGRLCPFPFD